MLSKAEIRERIIKQRRQLPQSIVWLSTSQISEKVIKLIETKKFKHIHTYLPKKASGEMDTFVVIENIWEKFPDIKISVPVSFEQKIQHSEIFLDTKYKYDKYLIPAPIAIKKIDINDIDLVIVPLVAFDKDCNRIGYGKGFYDKFLAQLPKSTHKLGLAYDFQEVDEIRFQRHDIKLDEVLTPTK